MRLVVSVLLSIALTGCAGHRVLEFGPQATRAETTSKTAAAVAEHPPTASLETFMAKVRKLTAEATPDRPVQATTIEASDHDLGSALTSALIAPSPETYRAVAFEYRRVRVFDREYQYLNRALVLDPRDSQTFDALARLWRDSGFPQVALADAHRAVFFAPESPVAHNTLGTILQALGKRAEARAEFERAIRINRFAAYALNNLCYAWLLEGEPAKALTTCNRALAVDPSLRAARNNLALALAVEGNTSGAQEAFAAAGDRAGALYNIGMVHLARREYRSAIDAFVAAHTARPTLAMAVVRAHQAAVEAGLTSEE